MNSKPNMLIETEHEANFTEKKISIIGVSVKEGQKLTGVEDAPNRFREGNLHPGQSKN